MDIMAIQYLENGMIEAARMIQNVLLKSDFQLSVRGQRDGQWNMSKLLPVFAPLLASFNLLERRAKLS
jgi:hypothetical protein